ncbi:MAG: nitroreductase [Alcaligenaceae bacterium]|nr:MAG: nitroreductase [Alcaligenaceae bacterium]
MPADSPSTLMSADEAITSRRSIRAFLPEDVPRSMIEDILAVASRAPSGSNIQPWKVYVVQGASKEKLVQALTNVYDTPELAAEQKPNYTYYPKNWKSPFIERRRKVGWDLYELLGLTRENKEGMRVQHGKNYSFFGAPVGLMFTIDATLEQGSWLDYGMFIQSVMVAARARGLDTCPQAAFVPYNRVVAEVLGIGEGEALVCGMALGWADPSAVENGLISERAPVAEFTTFLD